MTYVFYAMLFPFRPRNSFSPYTLRIDVWTESLRCEGSSNATAGLHNRDQPSTDNWTMLGWKDQLGLTPFFPENELKLELWVEENCAAIFSARPSLMTAYGIGRGGCVRWLAERCDT